MDTTSNTPSDDLVGGMSEPSGSDGWSVHLTGQLKLPLNDDLVATRPQCAASINLPLSDGPSSDSSGVGTRDVEVGVPFKEPGQKSTIQVRTTSTHPNMHRDDHRRSTTSDHSDEYNPDSSPESDGSGPRKRRRLACPKKSTQPTAKHATSITDPQMTALELEKQKLNKLITKRNQLDLDFCNDPMSEVYDRELSTMEESIRQARANIRNMTFPSDSPQCSIQGETEANVQKRKRSGEIKKTNHARTDSKKLVPGQAKDFREYFKRRNGTHQKQKTIEKERQILERAPVKISSKGRKKDATGDSDVPQKPKGRKTANMRLLLNQLTCSNPMQARMDRGELSEPEEFDAATKRDQYEQQKKNAPSNCDPKVINADLAKLRMAVNSFGLGVCTPAPNNMWDLSKMGMKSTLHNHQVIGVSWMLEKETSEDKGGILGDEMDLGKTVQTLACMMTNRRVHPDPDTPDETTLVVVPAAAVSQWLSEIEQHTAQEVMKYYDFFDGKRSTPFGSLQNQDVLVTTYDAVRSGYYKKEIRERIKSDDCSQTEQEKFENKYLSPLFKMKFRRVILDEAHVIKNSKSQTSIACCALKSTYKWCLTGTPVHNDAEEFWSYLQFLGPRWLPELKDFRQIIRNINERANGEQFSTMVKRIMIARKTSDSFMGQPLYSIPNCKMEIKKINLTQEEQIIYRCVESRYREITNELLEKRKREAEKESSEGVEEPNALSEEGEKSDQADLNLHLVRILRLRQATSHPFLLEAVIKDTLLPEDIENIKSDLEKIGSQTPVFEQIKAAQSNGSFGLSNFGRSLTMSDQLAMAEAWKDPTRCRYCGRDPTNAQLFDCGHILCSECANWLVWQAAGLKSRAQPKCPGCQKPLEGQRAVGKIDDSDDDDENSSQLASQPSSSAGLSQQEHADFRSYRKMKDRVRSNKRNAVRGRDGKKLGNDFYDLQPRPGKSPTLFLQESDKKYSNDNPMVPSAKTTAAKDAILRWLAEEPDNKIIIFTQFLECSQILGRMLQDEKIGFVYFYGDMTSIARDRAIKGFHDEGEIKVLVASLKCGGVALNLTCANRVILMDPWWNRAIELQAFARVFRIGQKKQTHFLSLIAENTIDERVWNLQTKKLEAIENEFVQGLRNHADPDYDDYMGLLGQVTEDKDGKKVVLADYHDNVD